ncbi:MAG: YolD-like family protein [Lysinibacillus sp.]
MNKDRGTIKWTALMLPEHTARLHEWRAESEKVLPIEQTDWQLADIERTLQYSFAKQRTVTITAVQDDKLKSFIGIVTAIHPLQRQISLQLANNRTTLTIDSIYTASVDDFYD